MHESRGWLLTLLVGGLFCLVTAAGVLLGYFSLVLFSQARIP